MTLRVAVQMDPLESINIVGDSSFALMLSAQARGHEVFHYDVGSLTLDADDRLIAHPSEITFRVLDSVPTAPEDGPPEGGGFRLQVTRTIRAGAGEAGRTCGSPSSRLPLTRGCSVSETAAV